MRPCVTLSLMLLCACTAPRSVIPAGGAAERQPELVGKVWVSTDASAAPGTFRIFLPDGTLVMNSCRETYRLAPWRPIDHRRIEWTEDMARIEAQITQLTSERLQLRLQLRGEVKEETYRLAKVPTVCPDMPR
jgi:hypothetical protein